MSARTTPPFRADHVGSLLRPPALLRGPRRHSRGEITRRAAAGRRGRRRSARSCGMQEEVGLQSATDGEFRRTSWHMDFIYQLGGIRTDAGAAAGAVPQRRRASSSSQSAALERARPGHAAATRSSATTSRSCARRSTTAVPKLTIPSPSMVHYRGGRAAIDADGLPRPGAVLGRPGRRLRRRRCGRLGELGCTLPAARRHQPRLPQRPRAARRWSPSSGGDAEHQHERYIRQINAALAGRPEGMHVTTHMCRGNFRSSWAAEGGYDFVAEALFTELEVDGFFLEYDDERSGGFEPLRFVPPGQAGRARPGHHQARRARGQGHAQAAHRRGREVRRRSTSSACRRSAASPPRSRATPSPPRSRSAKLRADRRDRRARSGASPLARSLTARPRTPLASSGAGAGLTSGRSGATRGR